MQYQPSLDCICIIVLGARAAAVQAALSRREEEMPMSSRRHTAEHAALSHSLSHGEENGLVSSGHADSRSSTPGTGGAPSQVRGEWFMGVVDM